MLIVNPSRLLEKERVVLEAAVAGAAAPATAARRAHPERSVTTGPLHLPLR